MLMQNSVVYDYMSNLTKCHILDEVNFDYVTEVQFNYRRVKHVNKLFELSVIHLNIQSINCSYRALCQFLELLVIKFDVIV